MKRYVVVVLILLSFVVTASAAQDGSAWDRLIRENPDQLRGISAAERSALKLLPSSLSEGSLTGDALDDIMLTNGDSLGEHLEKTGTEFEMSWFSVDSGAFRLSGGEFTLSVVVGQADAGVSTGGELVLNGGFLTPPGSVDVLFSDGFESGDTSQWSNDSLKRAQATLFH